MQRYEKAAVKSLTTLSLLNVGQGLIMAVGMTFVIPYFPGLLKSMVLVRILQVLFASGCAIGVRKVHIDADTEGQRVDNFLHRDLPGVPRSRIYRLLRRGEVRVAGAKGKL